MLRECPSIFSAEGDATLHDSCLDTTFFVLSVQKQVWQRWQHFLFSRSGATDIQSNVHLPVRQNPNLSTISTRNRPYIFRSIDAAIHDFLASFPFPKFIVLKCPFFGH
jgi:hypothetical protein